MKRSYKVIDFIYILFFLALFAAAGIILFGINRSDWEQRKETVMRNAEFAMDSFFSNVATFGPLSDEMLQSLSQRVFHTMDDIVTDLSFQKQLPENTDNFSLEDLQMISYFESGKEGAMSMQVLCRMDDAGSTYYLHLKSDVSALSKTTLQRIRYYAFGVSALTILAALFFLLLNLLWKETEKNKKFMENFTHEMKTPLTSILGYTEMLRSLDLNPKENTQALDAISFEANRLNHLSSQMLHLFVARNDAVELSALKTDELQKALQIPLHALSEKYQIPCRLSFRSACILGDKDLLVLTIANLADNALKATENAASHQEITLTGEVVADGYRISVRDHGTGISRKNMQRITEPFFRVDKARSRAQGGAGLGLSLCAEIIRQHHSHLTFASKQGVGTKVSFVVRRLPE